MSNTIHRAVALALSVGVSAATIAADNTSETNAPVDEVTVTGSRIQRDGMTTPTPVTSLSMDDLKLLAPTTLAAAVTQLPQFIGSSVPEGAPAQGWTGASGASILNLRGVGANRTLVLLDGRRMVPSTRRGTIDVNLLPSPLVDRVDVVTGGASAAYGSDAVSGVVNFLLDTQYKGFKTEFQGGMTDLSDNKNYTVTLSGGMPIGERLHLIASADYYHVDPIEDAQRRDWQQGWSVIANPLASQPGQPARITRTNVRSRQLTEGGLILPAIGPGARPNPLLDFMQFLPGGTIAPFAAGTDVTATTQVGGDPNGIDLAWFNYFTPESSRGSAFAHLTYDVSDNVSAFFQGLYGLGSTTYLSPPAGGQFSTWNATIFRDNAFLPADVLQRMVDSNVQSFRLGRAGDLDYGSSKAITQDNILKSFTTGLRADLNGWKFDAYYQYGRTDSNIDMDNAIRLDRIYQAIDAVRDPATGQIICNSTRTAPGNGCVPMNIFGIGAPSAEAIDWITQDISQKQITQQHVVDVTISGSPFENWAGPVSVATGLDWRQEKFTQHVYPIELHDGVDMPASANPAVAGYRGLPSVYAAAANIFERGPSASPSGGYKVKEAFAEVLFPLLGELGFSRSLNLSAATRFADYEGSGGIWAWKGGLDWQATTDLRFRVTRSRDVRAGSLAERFDTSRGPGNVIDPESGSSTQYAVSVVNGGNPEVKPEIADTLTYGVVYRPSWLEGFAVSVDAYDIDIKDAIGQLGVQAIVDQCRQGATDLCAAIDRGDNGFISLVRNLYINTDATKARGIDLESSFARPIKLFGGNENLTVRFLASYVAELSTKQRGAAKVDRAGQTGPLAPGALLGGAPEWQGTFSLGYTRGPLIVALEERLIDGGTYDATWIEGVDVDDNHVASAQYTNVLLAYRSNLGASDSQYELSLNITNLFDADPAIAPNQFGFTGSTATNSGLFDIYGRRYTLGVKLNF